MEYTITKTKWCREIGLLTRTETEITSILNSDVIPYAIDFARVYASALKDNLTDKELNDYGFGIDCLIRVVNEYDTVVAEYWVSDALTEALPF